MARPIKETPTLYGEDAIRFEQAVNNPRPVAAEDVRRAMNTYRSVIANSSFAW